MIKYLLPFLTTLNLFAFDVNQYNYLDKKVEPTKEQFQLNKAFDVSEFEYLNKSMSAIDQLNQMAKTNTYPENDFLTKEEFNTVTQKINESVKANNFGKREFILFFTSTSVPDETLFNILFSVGILQDNGIQISSKHYYTGFPEEFKEYMFALEDKVQKKSKSEIKKIKENFFLKIDPRMFYHFDIKKVPAIALAECETENPVVEKCDFKYLIRGDVSLINFFDKISAEDKKYQKYYDVLKANKIVSKEDFNEK